jgi:hypothetical protein
LATRTEPDTVTVAPKRVAAKHPAISLRTPIKARATHPPHCSGLVGHNPKSGIWVHMDSARRGEQPQVEKRCVGGSS